MTLPAPPGQFGTVEPQTGSGSPHPPGRRPRMARGGWIAGAWLCGLAAGAVVLALVIGVVDDMLPTGGRTPVLGVAPSDRQTDVGAYWYTPEQAEALSAELAAAVDGTDWCVGWSIVQTGDGLGPGAFDGAASTFGDHADVGSNLGPGRSARTCAEWAEVEVVYEYTASSSELEDNAAFAVRASDPAVEGALGAYPALHVTPDDLLHEDRGENTDDVIGNAIAALPLALAEQGRIDPLSVEPVAAGTAGAVTFEDREGEGGNDLLVANRTPLLVGALVVLAGLLLLCMAWGQVPARWFSPAGPAGSAWPTTTPPAQRAGNPRRALKQQMARARALEGADGQGGSR